MIKAKNDPERRARFSREANEYDTVTARGIPRLIESNAHRWEEVGVEPYIVTDFIEGPTLRQWRENRERVEFDEMIGATRELLAILGKCHEAGLVHRDVKPDNIILADDDPGRPVLLDFGLSFRKGLDIGFKTEHGQKVGNRFLRLAELSAGGFLKHDERSDLSFAAGILFYLLTGEPPYILQDLNGRLPHQRDEAFAMLQELAGARLARLTLLFDSAFEPLIENRFASVDAMLASMERVMEPHTKTRSEESQLQRIREAMDTQASRRQEATHRRLTEVHELIFRVFEDVQKYLRESTGITLETVRHGFGLANRFRLVLHTAAYWLMLALRDAVPRRMPLAWAEFATLRARLLKIGARVVERAARIRIHFASACPDAALFRLLAGRLAAAGP